MKKFYLLTKTLLVAALLMIGANAWAGVTTIYSQDYESATDASSWVTQNLAPTLVTGDPDYGKYIQMSVGSNNSRSTYTTWGNSFYGDHTTYTLEFDANFTVQTNNTKNQSSSFAVMADGYTLPSANWGYNSTFLFKIENTANTTTFTVNGSETTFDMPVGEWCHYTIVVDNSKRTAVYTITNKSTFTQVVTGTYNLPEGTSYKAVGMYYLSGRYWSVGNFDNISITTEVNEEIVSAPAITVDYAGANRTVTIAPGVSSESNAVTTYYTLNGEDPTSSSNVYSSPLDIDEDCTVKAFSISSTSVASTIASQAVTVGKLPLGAPTITKTGYSAGKYTVSITSDQSGLVYPPASYTNYYSIDGGDAVAYSAPFELTEGSTVTSYVAATNYTNSDEVNITAAVRPALSEVWSIDFAGQATEDKGAVTVGEKAFDANDVDFGNISGSFTSNDNFGVKTGSSWLLRNTGSIGLYSFNGSGTPVGVAGLKEGQYVKMVVAGMDTRSVSGAASLVDDMSTTTELYIVANEDGNACINFNRYAYIKSIAVCNVITSVSATISEAGYATFSSAYAVSIPDGVEAYAAKLEGDKVTLTQVDAVPANTGVILKAAAGVYDLPVVASAAAIANNDLQISNGSVTGDESTIYVLGDGKNGVGFYWLKSGNTLEAGKAYLQKAGSARGFIGFDGATGVNEVNVNKAAVKTGKIYNLNGQIVSKPSKGLFIVDGKVVSF